MNDEAKALASVESFIVGSAKKHFPDEAEDVAQQARLAVLLAFRSWKPGSCELKTHLRRNAWWALRDAAAKNATWHRRNRQFPTFEGSAADLGDVFTYSGEECRLEPVETAASPEVAVAAKSAYARLTQAQRSQVEAVLNGEATARKKRAA